jgi:hypothetical protein
MFTLNPAAVPDLSQPGVSRYSDAVITGEISVGSVVATCGSIGSLGVIGPGSSIFAGGQTSQQGFLYVDLELLASAPAPGPGYPPVLPPFEDLAPYTAGTLFAFQDAGGVFGLFEFELTSIRAVPEPDLLPWSGLGLLSALLRRRATSG